MASGGGQPESIPMPTKDKTIYLQMGGNGGAMYVCVKEGKCTVANGMFQDFQGGEVNVSANGTQTITNVQPYHKDTPLDDHIKLVLSPHGLNEIRRHQQETIGMCGPAAVKGTVAGTTYREMQVTLGIAEMPTADFQALGTEPTVFWQLQQPRFYYFNVYGTCRFF